MPRVAHVNEAAVAGEFALIGGYSAWFLHLLIAATPGGLEMQLSRSRVPPERRLAVLRAHAALGEVGTRWQLDRPSSVIGTATTETGEARLASEHGVRLGCVEVGVILGMSDRAVRKLAAAGALPGRRELSRWVFEPADIAAEHARRAAKRAAA